MQWALHTVDIWCGKVGLSVNPDKTELVFTRKWKLPGFFKPLFLHCSMSVKCLRVVPDSQLTSGEHVNTKVKKAYNLLWGCKRAYGATWGLRPKVVYWLYISIIWLSITFASLVWCPGCQTASAKKRQSRIQRLACLGIKGAMQTTALGSMEALVCLPPLNVVVQGEARSAAFQLWSLGCWSYLYPSREHSSILMWLQKSVPLFNMRVNVMRPGFDFETK